MSISWSTIAADDASVFVFTDFFTDAFTNVFIYVDELRAKNDLIKSLISLKSVRNPAILQTSDNVDPKNLLKEI